MDLIARKWENMPYEEQIEYLKRHKNSKLRPIVQTNEELESVKKVLKTYGFNRSIEGKQNKVEEQVNLWAEKLRELGFEEKQTDNGYKFIGNEIEIDLNVTKGKMRYFATFDIKPKQFEFAASKNNIRKQLKILYTNGDANEFIDLLNKNWFNPFKGGLADDKFPIDFNKDQLIKGIKVEFEHVSDIFKAAKIAMDHLCESSTYYTKLEQFEQNLEKSANKSDCKYILDNDVYYMKCDGEEKVPVDIDAPPMFKANFKNNNTTGRFSMFKHFARIHQEFVRFARKWEELTYDLQKEYMSRHPGTKRRITAQPPTKSETSGLKIYEPKRSQSHDILDFMRSSIGAVPGSSPVFRNYLTMREGTHNKYHYFVVMPDTSGNYVAANVYGRIGYPPKGVAILSRSSSPQEAEMSARKKMDKKMMKGYKPTTL